MRRRAGNRTREEEPEARAQQHGRAQPVHEQQQRQREVLFLHYYADLDYATIAGALGISPGTVGATLSTARARLRRALTPEVIS